MMAKNEAGEVIQFIDGYCYGIAPNLKTVCCGTEEEVKVILADPTKRANNPLVNEILDLEREMSKGGEDGTTRANITEKRRSAVKRGGLVRGTQHQGRYTKKIATGKRLPIR